MSTVTTATRWSSFKQRRASRSPTRTSCLDWWSRCLHMAAYVQAITSVVDDLAAVLATSTVDYGAVGRLLTEAHVQLRDRVRCSTSLIDTCVARMLAAGAYGAKLSGSGHGGCLFALVPEDAVDAVLAALVSLPVHAVALHATEGHGLVYSASLPFRPEVRGHDPASAS
jgi:hypothetical protein